MQNMNLQCVANKEIFIHSFLRNMDFKATDRDISSNN